MASALLAAAAVSTNTRYLVGFGALSLVLASIASCGVGEGEAPEPSRDDDAGRVSSYDPSLPAGDAASPSSTDDAAATDAEVDAGPCPGCKKLWIAVSPGATVRDLPGLFRCLFERTEFNAYAKTYAGIGHPNNGYGLTFGGLVRLTKACGAIYDGNDAKYACAVDQAKFPVGDHDVVMILYKDHCGGQNNARADGSLTKNGIRIRGTEIGDGTLDGFAVCQERIAVHEAFECAGDWANADCCTGEVAPGKCADNGEAVCPSCPCACGKYQSDGTYGGYWLDCGGGPKQYFSQRVSPYKGTPASEFDPNNCVPFTVVK